MRSIFSPSCVALVALLLAGCERGAWSTTTTAFRDSTLVVKVYEDRPAEVLIATEGIEPTTIEALNERASQGDPVAHRLLGNAYWQGSNTSTNGVDPFPRNRAHAVWYYRKGAEMGDVPSQYWLGHALEFGDGVDRNLEAALGWYDRAAAQGHVEAHGQLGYAYAAGEGRAMDAVQAVKHFRLAAEAGHAQSQFNLGVMYFKGEGVGADKGEAARWYWSAADQGHTQAMRVLARMLHAGDGISRDDDAARAWLDKAVEEGDDEARALQVEFGYADATADVTS